MRVLKSSPLFLLTGRQPYNKAPDRHTPICCSLLGGLMQRNTVLYNIIFLHQKDVKKKEDKTKHM